jgi:hypothetical protein
MLQTNQSERMQTEPDQRSVGDLLRELTTESRTLFRQEVKLAKAEAVENASRFGRDAAIIVVGAVVGVLAAWALIYALVQGVTVLLALGLPMSTAAWLSPLIVGVVLAGIGGGLSWWGLAKIRRERMKPSQTIQTLEENKEWAKEKLT